MLRTEDTSWVVWSFEHDAWWGPHHRGYTLRLEEAGRYTEDEAKAIVADANYAPHVQHEQALTLDEALRLGPPPR